MPVCRYCGTDLDAGELVRHEMPRLLIVHCPDCEAPLGHYRRHGDSPNTDLLRG